MGMKMTGYSGTGSLTDIDSHIVTTGVKCLADDSLALPEKTRHLAECLERIVRQ